MPARNLVWVLILAMIVLLIWTVPELRSREQTVTDVFLPLVDVRAEIRKRYVDEVDDKTLVRGAIEVRPLRGGSARRLELDGAPPGVRELNYFGGVPRGRR